jgi:PAS domain S-box-containing protein
LVGAIAINQDITELQRAENRIREQANLLDLTDDLFSVLDLSGRILYWNRGAERLLGVTAAQILRRPIQECFCTDATPTAQQCLEHTLNHGNWSGEVKRCHQSGETLVVHSRWSLLKDIAGLPQSILVVETDVTERKKTEARFLRAQRLESIGQLAGGIAHDLNNILAPIMMGAALVRETIADPEAQARLDMIESNAKRGANIIRQLLVFSRGLEGPKAPVSLNQTVRELGRIIRETFPKSVVFRTRAAPDLWLVEGDQTQLDQVLLNLCVNARDAMPNGGALTVETGNTTLDEREAQATPSAKPGPYVLVRISDTGTGIPAEIMERIFDPFFTTKGPDKGTGLGLSTVLGIVKGHGGFLRVHSEIGQGTQFEVYLPAMPPANASSVSAQTGPAPRGQKQMVLVIDDEKAVREVVCKTLENGGYRVLAAANGAEALMVYSQYEKEIQVVITDMMMPVMDGSAAILVLRKRNPGLKIVAISGVESARQREAQALGVHAFLLKPFTTETLLSTLGDLLRSAGQPSQHDDPT